MDPRHTLYRTFEKLEVNPKENMSATGEEAAQVQASSGVMPESIEKKLKERLDAVHVEIVDLSGTLQWIPPIFPTVLVFSQNTFLFSSGVSTPPGLKLGIAAALRI
jgi:hypothetical protein